VVLSAVLMWAVPELSNVIELAWDTGGVTTGPVSVPILLAVGLGVAMSQPNVKPDQLPNFGTVTLASLLPIVSVQLLALALAVSKSSAQIILELDGKALGSAWHERTPWAEILFAVRAISPLSVLLIFLILAILREPLPKGPLEGAWLEQEIEETKKDIAELRKLAVVVEETEGVEGDKDMDGESEAEEKRDKQPVPPQQRRAAAQTHSVPAPRLPPVAEGGELAMPEIEDGANGAPFSAPSASALLPQREASNSANSAAALLDSDRRAAESSSPAPSPAPDASPPPRLSLAQVFAGLDDDEKQQGETPAAVAAVAPQRVEGTGTNGDAAPPRAQHVRQPSLQRAETLTRITSLIDELKKDETDAHLAPGPDEARTRSWRRWARVREAVRSGEYRLVLLDTNRSVQLSSRFATVVRAAVQMNRRANLHRYSKSVSNIIGTLAAEEPHVLQHVKLSAAAPSTRLSRWQAMRASLAEHREFVFGLLFTQVGMILINFGLTYGLTLLGSEAGDRMPTLFISVNDTEPRFAYGAGLFLVMVFVFLLGTLATLAEPALNVLGEDVEELSRGEFSKRMLIFSVALGVGAGMVMGLSTIIFKIHLIYFLLGSYAVACALAVVCTEKIVNVAWDSAGVTTGPVTVPFVLSLGLAFGRANSSLHGFGILASASVMPIIFVQASSLLPRIAPWCRRPGKAQRDKGEGGVEMAPA
jgi:hypothetical protein